MEINFGNGSVELKINVGEDGKAYLRSVSFSGKQYISCVRNNLLSYVFFLGKAYRGKQFGLYGAVGETLYYDSHGITENSNGKTLCVTEKGDGIKVCSYFRFYADCSVLETWKEVENLSSERKVLDCVCPLVFSGISLGGKKLPRFYKPHNTWCHEADFERVDLESAGFAMCGETRRTNRIFVSENGTQTTNRYLPMGVFEKKGRGALAFEITPEGPWSYGIETAREPYIGELVVTLTGKNFVDNNWYKYLEANESYVSEHVQIVGGSDIDELAASLTEYRRITRVKHKINAYEHVIYNNFQHNTYDNPTEWEDVIYSDAAKECKADYYVVDAGWHDARRNGISPTQAIGKWEENKENYPSGVAATAAVIREKGLKFGLWVELQSFGCCCIYPDLLPEDCFFHVGGVRSVCNNRYQLDYSKEKVREWANGVIAKIISDYHLDYIKIDYNQSAFGNDCENGSPAEGVAMHCKAYEKWFDDLQSRYPDIIFETCASGGMRMDADAVRSSNVISVTDQGTYFFYPYLLANMGMAVLPEQTGIWNIPIRRAENPHTTDEEIIMNAVNSFYGVMHLSSRLNHLSEEQKELVREGVDYYLSLAPVKARAVPIMPDGLGAYGNRFVCFGLKTDKKLYLAVYNLSLKPHTVTKNLSKYGVKSACLVFPEQAVNNYELSADGRFSVELSPRSARAFEFDIE